MRNTPDLGSDIATKGTAARSGPQRSTDAPELRSEIAPQSPANLVVADLADVQHGVVGHGELLAAGLGPGAIKHRVATAQLHPLYRGVYAVGYRRLTRQGRWMAAVKAVRGVLSHQSAAELWGISPPRSGPVHATVPHHRARRRGIRLHETKLAADEVTVVDAIPVTSVARTLFDLAATIRPERVRKALNEAEVLRLDDPVGIPALLARYPRRRGTPLLRELLAELADGAAVTRGDLEDAFRQLVADHALPVPVTNMLVEGEEVDCAWPAHRLIVELDSRTFHLTRAAFEADRARDRKLQLAGWRVVRLTWRQVTREPERVAGDLRRLLS